MHRGIGSYLSFGQYTAEGWAVEPGPRNKGMSSADRVGIGVKVRQLLTGQHIITEVCVVHPSFVVDTAAN